MRPKTILLLTIGFAALHAYIGYVCYYVHVFKTGTMVRVYEDVYGSPKNIFRVGYEVLWFPAGPYSSLIWAVAFYGILRLISWEIAHRQEHVRSIDRAMRDTFVISFGVLIALSAIVWLVGILAGVVVPLFGGISAERLGAIGFTVGMVGEGCAYLFGWLRGRMTQRDAQQFSGFSGPRKYGNKNDVV